MSLDERAINWARGVGYRTSSHACVRTRMHACRTIMRFRAVAAAVDRWSDRFSLAMRVCRVLRACTHIYRLVLFTCRPPAARHERSRASGNYPRSTSVTKPPTLDAPERTPTRPTLVTSATSFFARFYILSALLFHPPSQLIQRASVTLIKTYLPSRRHE